MTPFVLVASLALSSRPVPPPASSGREHSAPVRLAAGEGERQGGAGQAAGPLSPEEQALVRTLAGEGVHFDPRRGLCAIPVEVDVREDLLEYLLVGPGGAAHEALFVTGVPASALNVALLSLGAEPGSNARWRPREDAPEDPQRPGATSYVVEPPEGDGFYLYAGWREGEEVFLYRVEDLVRNLQSGRGMRRHRWVYLGSRMIPSRPGGEGDRFAADLYQNLVNIAFFSEGYTLLTCALPECLEQSIWLANDWLLPERGTGLRLLFTRERLEPAPPEILLLLPEIGAAAPAGEETPRDR